MRKNYFLRVVFMRNNHFHGSNPHPPFSNDSSDSNDPLGKDSDSEKEEAQPAEQTETKKEEIEAVCMGTEFES